MAQAPPAQAQAYGSDWQAALAGGSARLQWFALQTARPGGAGDYAAVLQRHLALGQGGGDISHSISVAPVLDYDSNINGGTPGGFIKLGSFSFALDDAAQAKAGLVVGLAPSAQVRWSLAPGRVVELSANGQLARAIRYDLQRRSYGLRLCGAQYLGRADWLDICFGRRGAQRQLSRSDERYAALGFARQYASRYGLHEASLRLERVDRGDYAKTSLDFGATHAAARLGVVDWRIELGQPIQGQHTRLGGVTLSLTRPILGAQTTLFAAGAREGGAVFFGTPREDRVFRIGMSRAITQRVTLNLSAEDRRSSLENYTGTTLGFGLTFALPPLSGG